jgi:hypothetical protein
VVHPGEKGEVIVTFDSTRFKYAYMDTVVVTTAPGDVKSYLRVGAHVVPPKTPPATQQ